MLIVMGILALGVTILLLLPFLRARGGDEGTVQQIVPHIDEYKRRLAELERDLERGLMSQADAELARAEIGRQLLDEEQDTKDQIPDNSGTKKTRKIEQTLTLSLVAITPLLAFLLYFRIGNPGYGDQPLKSRQVVATSVNKSDASHVPSDQQIEGLISQLEARLAVDPDEAEGRILLARTYENLNRSADAERAWNGVLAIEPENADALWFAGVHAAQGGRPEEARAHWKKLQSQFNRETDDYELLEQALSTLG